MERLDPALLSIERDSQFLHERIAAEASNSQSGSAPRPGAHGRRVARWQDLLGGQSAFEERIAACGWQRTAVDAALAGAMGAIRTPGQLPSWIRLLGEVMAATPRAEHAISATLPFGELVAGFIDVSDDILGQHIFPALDKRALQSLERALAESVSEILAPCFLAEFAADRPAASELLGILIDDDSSSAYHDFINRHRSDGLSKFLTRYPVAARLAASSVENWVASCAEFLERLAQDLPDIRSRLLGMSAGEAMTVADIEPRLSDPHEHGRSVAIVVFSDGRKVVYKPRSLAPEAAWRSFVGTVGPPYATLAADVIDRGTHGWMEYVARQDCRDEPAVRAYYRSAGALLCLARAFSLKDLHFENIIAAGDRPVPIDLETIAQPQSNSSASTVFDRIAATCEAVLDGSVRDTEALPARYSLSDRAPIDISAFADLRSSTRRRPVWRGHATDAITRVFVEEPIPAANLPRLRGETCAPDGFVDEIIAGFETAWMALHAARSKLAAFDRITDMPVRFIFRATEVYYRLLARASDPEKLRNGIDFSIEIEALHRAAGEAGFPAEFRRIITAEIMALHGGDIPRFTAPAGATTIRAGHVPLLDDAFETSGLAAIHRRLENLAPDRLAVESRFIRASFAAARHGSAMEPAEAINLGGAPLSPDAALAAAIEIGHSIMATASPRADGGASWIAISHRPEGAGPMAIVANESLYEGTTGIGVFLAALYRATGERHWADMAERALLDARRIAYETPPAEKTETIARLGLGFSGLGGLLYGLTLAGDFLNSPAILDDAENLANWVDPAAITAQPGSDLLGGVAGAIPGLLAIAPRNAGARAAAIACGLALVSDDDAPLIDGFGHGASGVNATLALLADHDPSLCCTTDDTPSPSEVTHGPVGWCKGPIGQTLARMTARHRRGCLCPTDVTAVEHAVGAGLTNHHALDQVCCGLFGGVEALLAAARCGKPELSRKAQILAHALLERARKSDGFRLLAGLPPGFDSPGFFQGTSGIGYTLLRLARPHLFPSILLTEWRR